LLLCVPAKRMTAVREVLKKRRVPVVAVIGKIVRTRAPKVVVR
jgi:hypothetical protein